MNAWERVRNSLVIEMDDAPLSRLDLLNGLTDTRRAFEYSNRYGIPVEDVERMIRNGAIR